MLKRYLRHYFSFVFGIIPVCCFEGRPEEAGVGQKSTKIFGDDYLNSRSACHGQVGTDIPIEPLLSVL